MNVRTESSVLRESWLNIHFDDDCKRDFLGFCIEEGSSGGGSTVPTNNPGTVEPAGTLKDLIKAWEQCVSNPDTEWAAGECECTFGKGENGECVSEAEEKIFNELEGKALCVFNKLVKVKASLN